MTDTSPLLGLPPEVLLHILSFLDLPDLDCLATVSRHLSRLCVDPILHRNRLRIVAPSRVEHSLFAQGCHGTLLRPNVPELVRMNVLRGLGLERRWRLGEYIYSVQSVKQFESSLRLEHARVIRVLSNHLNKRIKEPTSRTAQRIVFPLEQAVSPLVSRRLLPTIASLKWSMKRDRLARRVRAGPPARGMINDADNVKAWLVDGRGRALVQEDERIRLAICPGVNKMVRLFESLGINK